jgi:hypothetical protein
MECGVRTECGFTLVIMAKKPDRSNYSRIQNYKSDFPKIGRAPIPNVISNTYRTVRVKPYWELTHLP